MSLMVPLIAAGSLYLIWNVLKNRTDRMVDEARSKNEARHKGQKPPCPNNRYVDLADVVSDKCQYDVTNYTVADNAHETADGRARCDLMTRHGRCVAGVVGVE